MQEPRLAMKVSIGLAALALALAGPASAQSRAEETGGRVRINDVDRDAARLRGEWTELADPSPTRHGSVTVMVGREAGNVGQLRLEATKGRVVVRRVKVVFDEGGTKVYRLGKNLPQPGKFVDIDLGTPRAIDHVVVTTETHTRGEYAVYGSSIARPSAPVARR